MGVTRELSSYVKVSAICQMVGEMQELGQEVTIADVAAFLGCTKETAKKYLDKSLCFGKVICNEVPYRSNRTMFVYELGEHGKEMFNSELWKSAKNSVLVKRGVINE